MLWKYRTILYEFTKDGLLGDRYVDDEEMEKNLNEMGELGWELVNVTLLQDGLLTILKRPTQENTVTFGPRPRLTAVDVPARETVGDPDEMEDEAPLMGTPVIRERPRPTTSSHRQPVSAVESEEEYPPLRGLEPQGGRERHEPDFVDDIRIS